MCPHAKLHTGEPLCSLLCSSYSHRPRWTRPEFGCSIRPYTCYVTCCARVFSKGGALRTMRWRRAIAPFGM